MKRIRSLALIFALAVSACSSGSHGSAGASTAAGSAIRVQGTWASAAGSRHAFVYFILTNRGNADDVLLGASSPMADRAIVQRTTSSGDVRTVDRVVIPAGGEVSFGPGEYDVELSGLSSLLRSGSLVRLVLDLERAGPIRVTAGVR